jgi:hypothetical protein
METLDKLLSAVFAPVLVVHPEVVALPLASSQSNAPALPLFVPAI